MVTIPLIDGPLKPLGPSASNLADFIVITEVGLEALEAESAEAVLQRRDAHINPMLLRILLSAYRKHAVP